MKNFLTPKIQTSAAHSSNSIEMRPHDSQSNRENATPSSGTFTLASYKEVTPSSPGLRYISDGEHKSVEVDSPQVESGNVKLRFIVNRRDGESKSVLVEV